MPKYDVKCANGHEKEVKLTYEEYDELQRGEWAMYCAMPLICRARMDFVLTAIPFVFAVNDKDFKVSKKKFGMGNLQEI